MLKLYALPSLYRQGELQLAALYETDVAMLVLKHGRSMSSVLKTLKPSVSESDYAELQRVATEIEERVTRMMSRS